MLFDKLDTAKMYGTWTRLERVESWCDMMSQVEFGLKLIIFTRLKFDRNCDWDTRGVSKAHDRKLRFIRDAEKNQMVIMGPLCLFSDAIFCVH